MRISISFFAAASAAALLLAGSPTAWAADPATASTTALAPSEDARFTAFLDGEFAQEIQLRPQLATRLGLKEGQDRLDDISDAAALADAKKFLTEKKSTFTNIVLDEDFGVGFEKLDISAIPAVFIYGPDGKEVQRFTWDDPNNQFTYWQVDQALAKLFGVKTTSK